MGIKCLLFVYSLKDKTSYEYSAYGTIFISKTNFAIYKFNYNLFYRNKKNPQYSVTVEYTPKKEKMYLNYNELNNTFFKKLSYRIHLYTEFYSYL